MVSPSRCPPWQPERPGPTRRDRRVERNALTPLRRDTIVHAANTFWNAGRAASLAVNLGDRVLGWFSINPV